MKTRILMFGWEFPPYNSGGLGVACLGLTKALSQRGADIIFIMPKRIDVRVPWARVRFADVGASGRVVNSALTGYVTSSSYIRGREGGMYGQDLLGEVLRYAKMGATLAEEEQFDLIYAHDWLSFGAGLEAKRVSGKPLIVHVHATEFDRCGGGQGINQDVYDIEKAGMEGADGVVAVSEMTKRIIVDQYGIPEGKVCVVHNGIDETTAPSGGAELPRLRALKAQGYSLVLFLGRITLQKGPDYFVRAAKTVLDRNPKVMFVVSGSGDMEKSMMELAARLGIGDKVLFTGFLRGPERHEIYQIADLFIMPSVSEPFGITSLEAMRMGTPAIISKQSGASEVIRHALKVDFWDVDEMTNKILSVVGYPGLSATLSQNGVREAAKLSWAESARKIDDFVHQFVH